MQLQRNRWILQHNSGEMFYSEEVDYKKYEEIEKNYFGYREYSGL